MSGAEKISQPHRVTRLNKYAIYAYTHGPVTGSGFLLVSVSVHEQRVNHDQMNVLSHSGSLLVELRVPPPPSSLLLLLLLLPPLFRQCEAHGRLLALAVRKTCIRQKAIKGKVNHLKTWIKMFLEDLPKSNFQDLNLCATVATVYCLIALDLENKLKQKIQKQIPPSWMCFYPQFFTYSEFKATEVKRHC